MRLKRVRCLPNFSQLAVGMSVVFLLAGVVEKVQAKEYLLDISRQNVEAALNELAEQTQSLLLFSYDQVYPVSSNPVKGIYSVQEALRILLKDTGLKGSLTQSGVITVSANITNKSGERSMQTKKSLLAAVIGFFVGSSTQGVLTQENPADIDNRGKRVLEEIIVTAQKREQNILEVPISITALGSDEISARGIRDFKDLSLAVPGLAVSDSGGYVRRIYIRGVGNITGSSALVGIYLDEVALSGSGSSSQFDVRTYDLERIEVLKGPQGTLYGQGSVGGTVRFITRNPEFESFNGRADATVSFTKDGAPSQQIQAVVNVPLVDDKLAFRVVGAFEHLGGWIDQPAMDLRDINDQNVTNVRAKMRWAPVDELNVVAMANVHRNDAGAPPIAEDDDGNFTHVLGRLNTSTTDDDYDIYNLTATYDLGNFDILSVTSHLKKTSNVTNITIQAPGLAVMLPFNLEEAEIFNQEVRVTSTWDNPLQFTVGAFYQDAKRRTRFELEFGALDGSFLQDLGPVDRNRRSKSWAAFGEASYSLTDSLEIGGGIRYFEDERSFFALTVPEEASVTFDALTPRGFIRFAPTENINLYASASNGFRSGGFNPGGQGPYDPEDTWTYELGAKSDFAGGAMRAEVALFHTDASDFQTQGTPIGGVVNLISNAGDVEIRGVEWALSFDATQNLTLSFNGNYVDTEYVEIRATNTDLLEGDPVEFIPEYQFDVSLEYDYEFAHRPGYLRLDYIQQGRASRIGRSLGFVESTSDIIDMLNVTTTLELSDSVDIGFFASNLLNDRGFLDPQSIQALAPRAQPRTYGVRLGVDF